MGLARVASARRGRSRLSTSTVAERRLDQPSELARARPAPRSRCGRPCAPPGTRLADDRAGALDLLLQQQDAVDQRFGAGRAARHVDVDRHDPIAAAHHRVAEVIVAAAVGAGAHRQDIARLGHLVVDLAQGRRHLVAQRAGDDHHVRLARARPEHEPEPVEIIARRRRVHHLDGAAGEPEGHRPHRARARPSSPDR